MEWIFLLDQNMLLGSILSNDVQSDDSSLFYIAPIIAASIKWIVFLEVMVASQENWNANCGWLRRNGCDPSTAGINSFGVSCAVTIPKTNNHQTAQISLHCINVTPMCVWQLQCYQRPKCSFICPHQIDYCPCVCVHAHICSWITVPFSRSKSHRLRSWPVSEMTYPSAAWHRDSEGEAMCGWVWSAIRFNWFICLIPLRAFKIV